MKRLTWVATGLALLLHAPGAPATTARGSKVFCWKATSASTEVYLMGSIHLGKEEFYPLAKEIEGAFDKAKYLVVEADEGKTDKQKLQGMVLQRGMYPEGETVGGHVPKDTMKMLTEQSELLGLPLVAVERMKPWLLSLTLSIMSVQKLGYKPDLGIDRHFLGLAKTQNKDVLELESAEFQIDLLSGFSEETQVKFLSSTLDEAANVKERMAAMVDAWSKGDAAALDKEMSRRPGNAAFQEKLIDERNVTMAKKIGGYLKTKDVHFVVVGAAHLVGEKGIVRLLEKDGFKVEQLERP
jgi:hypothetical protein